MKLHDVKSKLCSEPSRRFSNADVLEAALHYFLLMHSSPVSAATGADSGSRVERKFISTTSIEDSNQDVFVAAIACIEALCELSADHGRVCGRELVRTNQSEEIWTFSLHETNV